MKYRKLRGTDLKVSVIGIGGGAFKDKSKSSTLIKEIVRFGYENGINLVETAEDYGEKKITPAIKDIRDEIVLISKSFSSNKKEMKKSIRNSLKKLETNYIDIYMLHTVNSIDGLKFLMNQGSLDALKDAKKNGLIGYIGISGHRVPVLIEAIKTNEFDVVEVPYCIGAHKTEKLFKVAKEYGVGIIAIRVFGGGILIPRIKNCKQAAFMNPQNALSYVLSNPDISTALIGVSSIEHLEENLKALEKINLSLQERRRIEKKVKKFLGENFCRGCLACMPCKKFGWKFPIDTFLRLEIYYKNFRMPISKDEILRYKNMIEECNACGECEKNCPYDVPIIRKIKTFLKMIQ